MDKQKIISVLENLVYEDVNNEDHWKAVKEAKVLIKELKQALTIPAVVGRSEQLPQNLCTLNENTCDKGSGCKYPHCHL